MPTTRIQTSQGLHKTFTSHFFALGDFHVLRRLGIRRGQISDRGESVIIVIDASLKRHVLTIKPGFHFAYVRLIDVQRLGHFLDFIR